MSYKQERRIDKQGRLAIALAAVGIVAAGVAALGPAERQRTRIDWPPSSVPSQHPTRAWYTPLLLVARTPERLVTTIPCRLAAPLPAADDAPLVLSTARHPELVNGLSIRQVDGDLIVDVGRGRLGRFRLPDTRVDSCVLELSISGTSWSLRDPSGRLRSGAVAPVAVTSLFTQLDLASGPGPTVTLETDGTGTRQTPRQKAAAAIAALAALASLLLVAGIARWHRPRKVVRRALGALRIDDAAVVGLLLTWWVLAPTPYDDGWVKAREDAYGYLREFSNYYDHYGASLPLGYWLEWLERLAVAHTDELIVQRIPALLALILCWGLCRLGVRLVLGSRSEAPSSRLVLAVVYSLFAMAWGMTLRPEPFVALLVGFCLVAAIRFVMRPAAWPLAASAPLIALGVTAHPAGLATAAPVLAASPAIVAWARGQRRRAWVALGVCVAGATSLALTLLTLDADLAARRESSDVFRAGAEHGHGITDEPSRYWSVVTSSPPLQQLFVLLLGLTLVAYLARSRSASSPAMDVPGRSLAVAVLLLALTPSKWSWHLGILIAVGAVAVTVETLRLVRDDHARRLPLRSWIGVVALLAVGVQVWQVRPLVNVFDVRVESFRLRTEDWVTMGELTAAAVAAVVLVCLVRSARRHGRRGAATAAAAALPLVVVAVAGPMILFYVDRIAEDAVFTDGWTLPRQNVDALLGRSTCGLAADTVVPDRRSYVALSRLHGDRAPSAGADPDTASAARRLDVFQSSDHTASPWYPVPRDRLVGLYVRGYAGDSDTPVVTVEWGRLTDSVPRTVAQTDVRLMSRAAYGDELLGTRFLPWRFVAEGDFGPRPADATLIRVRPRSLGRNSGSAVTAPLAYRTEPAETVSGRGFTLVVPSLVPALPCARLPRIDHGLQAVPQTLVLRAFSDFPPTRPTGTAYGLIDLYTLHNLPTTDSERNGRGVQLYVVDTRIPGTALLRAERRPG